VREKYVDNEQIRSFIAIELPQELKSGLLKLQAELKLSGCTFVKWVDPEGIHLTLKFLGNIPAQKVDEVIRALVKASEEILPFQLETSDLGAFPNLNRPNVFWLGIGGDVAKLSILQKRVDDVLEPKGFPKEKRAFTPHLTLARIRETASPQNRRDFGELIARAKFEVRYMIKVTSISLMRSQLLPGGAVYSRLFEGTLSG